MRLRETVSVLLLSTGLACSGSSPQAAPSSSSSESPEEVLATVAGDAVTRGEVEQAVAAKIAELEFQFRSQKHQLIEATLRNRVQEKLLEQEAAEQGTTKEALLMQETMGKTSVSDAEVDAFYQQNQNRMGGRSQEEIAPQIRQYLEQQAQNEIRQNLFRRLEEKHEVAYHLQPFRVDLPVGGFPAKGPDRAPVTLVEFSDFECPYCSRFTTTLKDVTKNYGDRVKLVFRQFPLSAIHPNAQKAAEASLCAGDQDRFWEMHDLMFQEQQKLQLEQLKEKAARLGLDTAEFDECLDSGKYAARVQEDLAAGSSVGVSGTPAVFINGRPIPGGAVPYDVLVNYIEEELKRNSSGS